jgi:pimeloyl-ACP methyl ester carboxylesterase
MRIPVFFAVFFTHGQFVSSLWVGEAPRSAGWATSSKLAITTSDNSIKTYEHDGWTLSYRFQPASPGFEREKPILLVHPVGIGINSWFWERFIENWSEGPAIYAPDLIGCGIANGGDGWDPNERGLSFPLGWVKGVESLMEQHITSSGIFPSIRFGASQCVVVAQGGLAPVGVLLAARNANTVSHLVLTSPPTWKDMTTAVPEKELSRNFNFLSSPLVGPLAFGVLESTWAVNFFSNAFLFQHACDERWLELACGKATAADRPPVVAFNSGFCNHRSFEEELTCLPQPTLILCGTDDEGRTKSRQVKKMTNCVIEELNGKSVLPWESPMEVVQAIKKSCYSK